MNPLRIIANNAIQLQEKKVLVSVYLESDVQQFILDLNRLDQLFEKGISTKEEIIGTYSSTTELLNPEKRAGTPYTLKDTGDFYASFGIKLNVNGDLIILADTQKDDRDLLEINKDILGLTNESKGKLIQEILPLFIEETRQLLSK